MALEATPEREATLMDSSRLERDQAGRLTRSVEASDEMLELNAALEGVTGEIEDLLGTPAPSLVDELMKV